MSEANTEETALKQQLSDAFMSDLRELMKKHGVSEIVATDFASGYYTEDIRMVAEISSIWEGNELKRPYIEINLGKGFYAEP